MSRTHRTVIIFVKAPRRGAVKTRLAADLGTARANFLYRQLTRRTLRQARALPNTKVILAVTPDCFVTRGRFWPAAVRRRGQGPGDLGQRMARALEASIPGLVLLVGSDIPGMTSATLARAFAQLRCHDYVFGPAEDGGFWLVGVRTSGKTRRLFGNVRWSDKSTLADTLGNIAAQHSYKLVDTLRDLDTVADLPAGLQRMTQM